MSARAGIVVTGTEVLTGRVSDRNGPWLAEQLRELGVDLAYTAIVGDRPEDMLAALRFMADQQLDIVLTSGGLGPTADDLTAEVVGGFQSREMELDEALERRIAEIVRPLMKRWPNLDLEPVGTAPGLVVPPREPGAGPTVIVLPGPPRELQPMFTSAVATGALSEALKDATSYRQRMLRLFGIPESEIAETLREAEREHVPLQRLEITTCMKRGEIEIVTRYEPGAEDAYEQFAELVAKRHADTLFSEDGSSVDDQVAALLRGSSIAIAESCTGGLLAARLTDPAGASEYMKGGVVVYGNEAKISLASVDRELLETHGAVSAEVAEALAEGARSRLGAEVGVGVTGIAGPGGGTEQKPVGLVWFSVAGPQAARITRSVNLPGARADVRDRASTVAMHLIRRALTSS